MPSYTYTEGAFGIHSSYIFSSTLCLIHTHNFTRKLGILPIEWYPRFVNIYIHTIGNQNPKALCPETEAENCEETEGYETNVKESHNKIL